MVDLVLPGAGGEVDGGDLEHFALEVVRLHLDVLGPAHLGEQAGEAQTAFVVLDRALAFENDGVDEDAFLVVLLRVAGEVEDEQLIGQRDLIGGEAKALVGVHQLQHLGGVHPHLLIDGGQRPGDPTQGGMGVLHDLHYGHPPTRDNKYVLL